jgi:CobQ/CobB/MinD/ParA nucleotide binding domain
MEAETTNGNGSQTNTVHLSLQGKGGVGKSLMASILAQYLLSRGIAVQCIDTDPVNRTLMQYEALKVQPLKLLREGGIDQRGFDTMIDAILTADATFVVDNGAATFIPLWNYILENNVRALLRKAGKRLCVHTVITGGQALGDTLKGFAELAATTTDRSLVIWLNEFFGRIEHNGKTFVEMAVFKDNQQKILGSIAIPKRNQDTFGRDMEEMIARKQTFDDAIQSGDFSIMTKQRLKVVQRDLYEQLDALPLF